MTDATKHSLASIAIAVVGIVAAAVATMYPNRQDLVYAIATIVSILLGGRAVTHAATINAASPSPPLTLNLTPMAPTIRTEAPPIPPVVGQQGGNS